MIDGIGRVWNRFVKRTPAVPKPAKVDGEGVMAGSDNETREHHDYSEKKKAEAQTHYLYDADGKKVAMDDDDPHPKLDEIG